MDRYFNREKLKGSNKYLVMCYVLFGVILLPLIIILIAGIQEGETHMIVTVSILLTIMTAELVFFILVIKKSNRAKRYAPIFEEDHDGILTYKRIDEMTGYGVERIKKDVNWLLQAGYLQNAVADEEKVILLRENEFINITCPTCGASNEIRIGSSNKCKHCGSYLRRV
ncbi:MAG: hypothetical protein IK142_06720 [Clostridiales bacterium]|nr:hypothetical protein [Clostridiales bacterium]